MAEKKDEEKKQAEAGKQATQKQEAPEKEASEEKSSKAAADKDTKEAPRVKIKPELDEATRQALEVRAQIKKKTPTFRRPEWFRYKKLSRSGWRRPFGIHSKQRRHYGYRPNVVSVGYGGPAAVRGLHPSGFREVLVHNVPELKQLDPKTQAARIAKGVGSRKREMIMDEAERLKIRVLNPLRPRGDEE